MVPSTDTLLIGASLRLDDVARAAEGAVRLALAPEARERVARCREALEAAVAGGGRFYGINTGFADNRVRPIPKEALRDLQRNLIRSHAAGVGAPYAPEVVRAAMAIRVHNLAQGYSGVRPSLVDALIALFNAGIVPAVPEFGSVGASGDLAPLSHLALVLLGEGRVLGQGGQPVPAGPALAAAGLGAVELETKEGLALCNGTAFIAGLGVLAVALGERLADTADLLAAVQLEAMLGVPDAFLPEVHRLRPHPGVRLSAARIEAFTAGSGLMGTRAGDPQDDYCLRCAPQVHGAARQVLGAARAALEIEIGSVTDNPVILPDFQGTGAVRVVSAGHFHGEPLAVPVDGVKVGLAEIASIAERRIAKAVDGRSGRSYGLPNYLVAGDDVAGLRSGLMIAQYCAASLVNEARTLSHPHSVDSIPTGNDAEDHVSMGTSGARTARIVAERCADVLGVELVVACQALELRTRKAGASTLRPGPVAAAVLGAVREAGIAFLDRDEELAPRLARGGELVRSGALLRLPDVREAAARAAEIVVPS